ncbi:DEAD/DEAH box helicase [Candidatus Nomurabacteria bacterium]|nr:DEAD/DEAH box helicase [Candidatus Nomurabacteria bacterium]
MEHKKYAQVLKNSLKKTVGPKIYIRGDGYYDHGRIDNFDITVAHSDSTVTIEGKVRGTRNYKTSGVYDSHKTTFTNLNCSCPYRYNCKHATALALKFIEECEYIWGDFADNHDPSDASRQRHDVSGAKDFNELSKRLNFLGIDTSNLSKDILEQLQEAVIKTNPLQPLFSDLADMQDHTHLKQATQSINYTATKVGSEQKPFSERYFVNITAHYTSVSIQFSQFSNNYYYNNSSIPELDKLLREENLTKQEQVLIEYVKHTHAFMYSSNTTDYGELFKLIRDSGLIVREAGQYGKAMSDFHFAEEPKKLPARLYDASENVEGCIPEFIFELDPKYSYSASMSLLVGKNNLVVIDKDKIYIHKIPRKILQLISRATENQHTSYGYKVSEDSPHTTLTHSEVIHINSLITSMHKYLDYTGTLEANFTVTEKAKAKAVIVADYDYGSPKLIVSPSIDYGLKNIPIGQLLMYRASSYGSGIKRKKVPGLSSTMLLWREGSSIWYVRRNKTMEIKLFIDINENHAALGFNQKMSVYLASNKTINEFIISFWPKIEALGYDIIFPNDDFTVAPETFTANADINLDTENDWLTFDVETYCGDGKVDLQTLRNYISGKSEFFKDIDGNLRKVENKDDLERFILMLESFYERENGLFEGRTYNACELESVFTESDYYTAKFNAGFKKFTQEAKRGRPVKKVRLPKHFEEIMRAYQKEGIDWAHFLQKYHFGGVLADDMGLGKTLQTLALISMSTKKKNNRPSLVVAPKSLLYNWMDEVTKFAPHLKAATLDDLPSERKKILKNAAKYDVLITSYPILQKDFSEYERLNLKFNYCILDEAQSIKNHQTKNAQVVKKVNASYRLALTGTPLENTVAEIWSIFEFLMPGFLGKNSTFVKQYQNPIMNKNSTAAITHLRRKISPFMLRRTKSAVLKELPSKIEQVSHVELTDAQNVLYQEVLANIKQEVFDIVKEKGFKNAHIHILAGLTKLRQVCNHPFLLLKKGDYREYESAKMELCLELVREISSADRKVLVFSQFTSMLDILACELDGQQVRYSYLSGKTRKRQDVIKAFTEDPKISVFLISLKAGGTGLNLTAADNVIIFDPWWNPSVERQAMDRAHRIGQKNSVNVYRLITKGTIEDKIVALQQRKKALFDSLVSESADLFKKLTWEEVQGLFE